MSKANRTRLGRDGVGRDGWGRRRRWAARGLGAGVAAGLAALLPMATAEAQLLPQMGTPVDLGDLRGAFERAYGPGGVAPGQPSWSVTPGIDVEVRATDNSRALQGVAGPSRRGRQSELLTIISPSLAIQGTSQRLTGSLFYAPSLRNYMRDSRQNGIGQNLSATARATIFEDLLFLNASALASETSRAGGLGQGTGRSIARQDQVQTTSFTFGPQLRHAFGDYGAVDLGYTFSHLTRSGQNLRTNTAFAPAVNSGSTITNNVQASFTSGQAFGRINFGLSFQRTDYDGPGVLRNSTRQNSILDLGYAATRTLTLLGQAGHQEIRYGGTRPISISDAIWSLGARWNPDPDTTMTARFGYRDGGNNFFFEGVTAPTARTRVTASYSEAMASLADELQASLGRGRAAGPAILVDQTTGMPILVNDNFAGAQGGVSRVRRASISAVLLQDIDTFSLSFNRDDRITLSSDVPGAIPGSTFYRGTFSWQRELGPGVRGNVQASYGERVAKGGASQDILTLSAGLNWSLSETLSTRATYTYTRAGSPQPGFSYDANLLSLGLRKTF